jgi:hypothetical protein
MLSVSCDRDVDGDGADTAEELSAGGNAPSMLLCTAGAGSGMTPLSRLPVPAPAQPFCGVGTSSFSVHLVMRSSTIPAVLARR